MSELEYMRGLGKRAKEASKIVRNLSQQRKIEVLESVAREIRSHSDLIVKANQKDVSEAKKNKMSSALLDRLLLTEFRVKQMADGIEEIAKLEDPVGQVLGMKIRPNGLQIGQKRVPLGVVGIIYESRPNVTGDAFGLCFKTGNVTILRGGSDAIHSNAAIAKVIRQALRKERLPKDALLFVENTSRIVAEEMMRLTGYIDVLIPRGGAGLIKTVVKKSQVPVIETGTGNCHVFVDRSADLEMALSIIENAKTQRYGVCNACESLVVHEKIADKFLPKLVALLEMKGVEVRGDRQAKEVVNSIHKAEEEDWGTEYLDATISLRVVKSIQEAINHINTYNSGHSEAIITKNYTNALKFQEEIDAAVVYVNASTRFTDGYEFGFGAEIGISTQKLHVRGPMGLEALTTTKYIVFGNGQIR